MCPAPMYHVRPCTSKVLRPPPGPRRGTVPAATLLRTELEHDAAVILCTSCSTLASCSRQILKPSYWLGSLDLDWPFASQNVMVTRCVWHVCDALSVLVAGIEVVPHHMPRANPSAGRIIDKHLHPLAYVASTMLTLPGPCTRPCKSHGANLVDYPFPC